MEKLAKATGAKIVFYKRRYCGVASGNGFPFQYCNTHSGSLDINACRIAFAKALEIIPRTLAENAGMDPINTLISLKSEHEKGLFPYLLLARL